MRVAIGIVNRNLPEFGDRLGEKLSNLADGFYLLENGSDPDKYSKYANILVKESNGASWAVNHLVQRAIDENYDLIWILYNDAWHEDFEAYLNWSKQQFSKDDKLGMTVGYWTNIWDINGAGDPKRPSIVSFFDPISFIVSTKAIKEVSANEPRLTPFWDHKNYASHYLTLSTCLGMYQSGYHIKTDPRFAVKELQFYTGDAAEDDKKSVEARGYTDDYWRSVLGPEQINTWLNSYFPELASINVSNKQKRNLVIAHICSLWRKGIQDENS